MIKNSQAEQPKPRNYQLNEFSQGVFTAKPAVSREPIKAEREFEGIKAPRAVVTSERLQRK